MNHIKVSQLIFVSFLCLGCGNRAESPKQTDNGTATNGKTTQDLEVVCPICGLKFQKSEAQFSHRYKNCVYYFLLEDHKKAFVDACEQNLSLPGLPPEKSLCRPQQCD